MNNLVLMAEIIQAPELRYTSENQTSIAEMLVQFPGLRDEDAPATLKVVGWGKLAEEIQEQYHQGDRVVIEGRLGMNSFDRPEGFKETRAELTVQKIHLMDQAAAPIPTVALAPTAAPKASKKTAKTAKTPVGATAPAGAAQDFDDIAF
jgi:single-strand DNA-binding protein